MLTRLWLRYLQSCLIFSVRTGLSQAHDPNNFFYTPSSAGKALDYADNPVYQIAESISVNFTTNYSWFIIYLYQQTGPNTAKRGPRLESGGASGVGDIYSPPDTVWFGWTITTGDLKLNDGEVFFLGVNGTTFVSHYFNITDPYVTLPSSTVIPSPTLSTMSPSPTQSATQTYIPAHLPVWTPSQQRAPGLNTAVKVGLGAGIAVAGLLMLVAGFLLWWRSRQNRKSALLAQDPLSRNPFLFNGEKSGDVLSSELDAEGVHPKALHSQDYRAELQSPVSAVRRSERRVDVDGIESDRDLELVEMPAPDVRAERGVLLGEL